MTTHGLQSTRNLKPISFPEIIPIIHKDWKHLRREYQRSHNGRELKPIGIKASATSQLIHAVRAVELLLNTSIATTVPKASICAKSVERRLPLISVFTKTISTSAHSVAVLLSLLKPERSLPSGSALTRNVRFISIG